MAVIACAQPLTFDVASLKPSPTTGIGDLIQINLGTARHGVLTLTNVTLSDCMRYAYGITNDAQISGPDWIRNKEVRFDIVAKSSPETPDDQLRLMLRTLLTERFKLVLHREPRELPYLALTVGKNGPKLVATNSPDTSGRPQILGRIISSHMSMPKLAMLLSRFLRQTVLDQTGLTGPYDVNLTWTPENSRARPDTAQAVDAASETAPGPSIYTRCPGATRPS